MEWWGLVGGIIVAVLWGAWQGWKKLSPDMRAERAEERKLRRRDRRRLGRTYEWGEAAELELFSGRRDRREHDDQEHRDGEGAIGIRELPPQLKMSIREWASQGEETDDE